MSDPGKRRVLYIEDDPALARLVQIDIGRRFGYAIETVGLAQDGLRRLSLSRYDVVALDHNLPDRDGIDVLRDIRALADPPPVVYVTGADDSKTAVAALKSGATDYVIKQPENGAFFELLSTALQAAIDQSELRRAKEAAEAALRENERRLMLAMDAGAFGAWSFSFSENRAIVSGSDRFWVHMALPGTSEAQFVDALLAHVHIDDKAQLNSSLEAAIALQQSVLSEFRVVQNGAQRWIELRGQHIAAEGSAAHAGFRIVGVSTDVTSRKLAEAESLRFTDLLTQRVSEEMEAHRTTHAELVQAQKMEVVGQLTGGVAHDFNNLLTVIIGNLELIQGRVKADADQRSIAGALQAAERAAELTRQLLSFARKQHFTVKAIELSDLMSSMDDLVTRSIGSLVRVERVMPNETWKVSADPVQLELAILNLAINARDAMPLGGTLQITAANIPAGSSERPAELSSGADYVMIAVADTGAGMPPEVQRRAFEPFFTTKDVGKGSGLGLSMVYGFTRQSGGTASIESVLGRGTTVKLFLPSAGKEAAENDTPELNAGVHYSSAPTARILLVDDDTAVRDFVQQALENCGHRVLAVSGGPIALEAFISSGNDPFDLVLADFSMPQMDGSQLLRRIRELSPGTGTLLMTGFADTKILSDVEADAALRKPFKLQELTAAVDQALKYVGYQRPTVDEGKVVRLNQPVGRRSERKS